jgi:hypothetical protein
MTPDQIKQQLLAAADELDRKDEQISGLLTLVEEMEAQADELRAHHEAVLAERDAYYSQLITDLIRRAEDSEMAVDAFINQMPSMMAIRAEEN